MIIADRPATAEERRRAAAKQRDVPVPGILAVTAIAAAAWVAGVRVPLLGAPVLALLAGVIIRNAVGSVAALGPGVEFTLKRLLRLAIILYGATLSFGQVIQIGAGSLVVIGVTIAMALGFTWLFGRWLRAPAGLVNLIGVGTAICGATAIITIGPIIQSREEEIAFAVTTIFLFNMLAVVIYPLLGHALSLSEAVYGVWAGAAIHDTSSVLAASFVFSESSGRVATVVKLTRTLALVPLALIYGVVHSYARSGGAPGGAASGGSRVNVAKIFPWFILWFVLAALLNTAGLVSAGVGRWASLIGRFLIIMVMAAVGLSADLTRMRQIGLRPLYIGLAASVMIAVISITMIRLVME